MLRVLLIILFCLAPIHLYAQSNDNPFHSTKLPLPRFASLRSDKTFVRAGPGPQYPVKWVYKKSGAPVEIILEYKAWRKIRNEDGVVGWVHKSLLIGHRTGVVIGKGLVSIYKKPKEDAGLAAQVEPKTIVNLDTCGGDWCKARVAGYSGWIERKNNGGVYESEKFN